jgi:HK97 family phage prohead protease
MVEDKANPVIHRRHVPNNLANVRIVTRVKDKRGFTGYGAVFYDGSADTQYEIYNDLVERVMPGAFDRAIEEDDVRGLFNHSPDNVLGRTTAGTMRLSVDERGLKYDIDAADTTVANDLMESIGRGDITGSSFAFTVTDEAWRMEDRVTIREVLGVRLFDTGPVTFPAYEGTEADIRKARDADYAAVRRARAAWESRTRFEDDAGSVERKKLVETWTKQTKGETGT